MLQMIYKISMIILKFLDRPLAILVFLQPAHVD